MQSKESIEAKIEQYKQAIGMNPNDGDAYYNLGIFYGKLGNHKEAIEALRQAVKINPNDSDAHFNLGGIAYALAGDRDLALEEYKILKILDEKLANKLLNLIEALHRQVSNQDEVNNQVPAQYDKLLDLLIQYSKKYYAKTESVFKKFNMELIPHLSKFEIDLFFFSLLSFSICELQQDMEVIQDVQTYITKFLTQNYKNEDTLWEIIESRVKNYCKLKHDCINNNRNIEMEMLDRFIYHIDGANAEGILNETYPVVIRDFFKRLELKSHMLPIQMRVAGEFSCCLKHIFNATSDIRLLSSEEIDRLIDNGKKDAIQILSKLDLSQISDSMNITKHIRTILAERKKWWQFWK